MTEYKVKLKDVVVEVFETTDRNYRQFANDGIVPQPKNGWIDLGQAAKAFIRHWKKKALEGPTHRPLTTERTQLTQIKKEQERLKLEKMRGDLVDKEQSIQWVSNLVVEIRAAFLSLPRRLAEVLAPITNPKEIEFIIREEIFRILFELSKSTKDGSAEKISKNSRSH